MKFATTVNAVRLRQSPSRRPTSHPPNANEAQDCSRASFSLTLRTFDLATAVSGWEVTHCFRWSGDCSPFHFGHLRFACAFHRLSVATFPAVQKDRQSSFVAPLWA